MIKTVLEIDGMMCNMCEVHMNDVIRRTIPDAKKIKSSHKKNMSKFVTEEKPDIEKLKKAIDEIGYKILSVDYQ